MYPFFSYSIKRHYFQHSWYNFELLRLLGSAPYEGCEAAEFLETVTRIRPNSAKSWEEEFLKLAEATEALARDAESHGLATTARSAYLRASNYYRCAQYLYPAARSEEQTRLLKLYDRSASSFEAATTFFDHPVYRVSIPYSLPGNGGAEITLPGRLYLPSKTNKLPGRKSPIVVCIGGADSTLEELYFVHAADGPRSGYAVLTYDGPGQGIPLRRDKLVLRPDYEVVAPIILDWIEAYARDHPEADLDVDAIALVGQSMGAFLALRAAVDPRVKAVVAIDPFYDMWDMAMSRMRPWMIAMWEKQFIIRDSFMNWAGRRHGRVDIATRYSWGLGSGMFGIDNGAEMLRNMKKYSFKPGLGENEDLLANVRCPVLISAAAADKNTLSPLADTQAIHRGLRNLNDDDKELWIAKTFAEGGGQAKVGAWSLLQYRTYKFLDKKLAIRPVPPIENTGGHKK